LRSQDGPGSDHRRQALLTMTQTPISDAMKASGDWNSAWDEAAALDSEWIEDFLKMGTSAWAKNVLDAKTLEFIAIAVDASCTHMYAPGTRRHIAKALDLGATPQEIMSVLQAVAVLGIHSVAMGAPMLLEEMNKRGMPIPENSKETHDAIL
jgi:alkylhydroperoxidase/carboxymuconolactone decarboxylase family protein YurZ